MANQNLSHEEIWDDSELVDTWNEAVEEYKKYHSLAARGEKVAAESSKPTLQSKAAAHLAPNGPEKKASPAPANFLPTTAASSQAQPQSPPANPNPPPMIGPALPPPAAPTSAAAAAASASALPILASLPQTFLGSGYDENLRNIMMSWYYAGYYTGLYEGQQKAYVAMQESMHNETAE